ncbi:hypothetical protein CH254_04480 [Rhodococcus sp. 06-412-2C]|uniref:hypothetical protein n=1 Tax=unclassified Rhodococcus (in: high G+C Gram-positive bacteria) TaxID=192944 RepID=UPI000B9BC986|nr:MULTISPECIES: hypothetical protein [unclassified Rhodococcus (in: high G+C Gram-positive bacteria)]OZC91740.1 hypothetical protein CH254_04480 [Rhodococcus sp. 06-412-2C]OZC92308.1 hypothetical protein CH279_25755 [Rhodococcus sp. 06-412-2B]
MVEVLRYYSNNSHLCKTISDLQKRIVEDPGRPPETGKRHVNHRVRLDSSDKKRLVERYAAGASANALVDEFRVSKKTILALLREHKAEVRRQPLSEETVARICELYVDGRKSIAAVAELTGVPHSTVRNTLLRQRVVLRGRHDR